MRGFLAMTVLVFAGFGLLLPLSPLWAVEGGADERGAGLVTATLMLFTVIAQLRVNAVLSALDWARILALGLILLAVPAPVQALTPDLWLILLTSATRGLGFGILTVCGATAISLLVAPEVRGRAVGAYGLVIAVPQLALTPAAPWLMETFGFPLVAAFGAVPLIALPWMPHLGRRIAASPHGGATPSPRTRTAGPPTAVRIWARRRGATVRARRDAPLQVRHPRQGDQRHGAERTRQRKAEGLHRPPRRRGHQREAGARRSPGRRRPPPGRAPPAPPGARSR